MTLLTTLQSTMSRMTSQKNSSITSTPPRFTSSFTQFAAPSNLPIESLGKRGALYHVSTGHGISCRTNSHGVARLVERIYQDHSLKLIRPCPQISLESTQTENDERLEIHDREYRNSSETEILMPSSWALYAMQENHPKAHMSKQMLR